MDNFSCLAGSLYKNLSIVLTEVENLKKRQEAIDKNVREQLRV